MRVHRVLFQGLVLALGATQAFGQSVNLDIELQLGPAVPLGSYHTDSDDFELIPVEPELGPIVLIADSSFAVGNDFTPTKLTFPNDEVQYLPGAELIPNPYFGFVPIPVIGRPIPAQLIEPSSFGMASACPIPAHPDEIQFHLSAASALLANLNLPSEAQQIQGFQQQFQRDHYFRLLVEHKESQLRTLQAEIANLKQARQSIAGLTPAESPSKSIELQLQIVTLNQPGRECLAAKLSEIGTTLNRSGLIRFQQGMGAGLQESPAVLHELRSQAIRELLDQLTKDENAEIVRQSSGRAVEGYEFNLFIGNESSRLAIKATPKTIGSSRIHLEMLLESIVGTTNDGSEESDLQSPSIRLETAAEISSGNSLAIVGYPANTPADQNDVTKSPTILVLVTPTVIGPQVDPASAFGSILSPVPEASARPVKEATVTGDK